MSNVWSTALRRKYKSFATKQKRFDMLVGALPRSIKKAVRPKRKVCNPRVQGLKKVYYKSLFSRLGIVLLTEFCVHLLCTRKLKLALRSSELSSRNAKASAQKTTRVSSSTVFGGGSLHGIIVLLCPSITLINVTERFSDIQTKVPNRMCPLCNFKH